MNEQVLHSLTPDELTASAIPETAEQWLRQLPGSCTGYIKGENSSQCRVIVTLLHGNETSGLLALHQWLRDPQRSRPHCDIHFILGNVEAARTTPVFFHRHLPDERDLNRCFRPPWQDQNGKLAQQILTRLIELAPEAILDIHNTSGQSPAFVVSAFDDGLHRGLAARFSDYMIVTDLRIGALLEISEDLFPTITLEAGGTNSRQANETAGHALTHFCYERDLLAARPASGTPVVFHNPVRVEMTPGCRLGYQPIDKAPTATHELTLREDIETLNFMILNKATQLGWLQHSASSCLVARDLRGNSVLNQLVEKQGNLLVTRQPIRIFMATRRADIAAGDCLFYALPVDSFE